ncbi:MAG: DoxX family protein [Advenella sp.]|nr:DoxX family protein [Advenella sp.]
MNVINNIKFDMSTVCKLILSFFRLYLGAWMIVSGTSYWLHQWGYQPIFPQPFGSLADSSKLLITFVEVGLFDLVKTLEVVGGLMLVCNVFVPLGLVILFPISGMVFFNAIFLNQRYDGLLSVTYMGTATLYMNVILLLAYIRYYLPLLSLNASTGRLTDLKRIPEIFK